MLHAETMSSGIPALDRVIMGLRLGDNVVWQVDSLESYRKVADPFVREALSAGRKLVHVCFAPCEPFLTSRPEILTVEVDPRPGFDSFSGQVNRIIEEQGFETFYVFDNLSSLVADWATDELLANFFQVTCPYLRELDTVAYFALTRGQHLQGAVARIRDTTQVLIDLYPIQGDLYIHPLKVWDRYSSQMFLPHRYTGSDLDPIFQSSDASSISLSANRSPLRVRADSIAPWDTVYRKLMQYGEEELRELEQTPEIQALKQELSQMIIGSHPNLRRLADRYLTLDDLLQVRNRLVGSGRIGGKAAGMLLARAILRSERGSLDFSEILEEHDSFYIGSDVFFTFLIHNNLFRLRLRLTRDSQITPEEYDRAEARFLAGRFPGEIMEQFKDLMDYFGQAPIIVRSSSLLEDGFGNAFAGKYRSEFCVNQGGPDERLDAFLRSVKLVYASVINPDALAYRKQRGLGEADEQMAILVQRVSGSCYRSFFFPPLAGVAFSHNLYRWTDRIDAGQGIVRLVFGLGTRAVNRVGGDYPRLVALSHPMLRPETGSRIASYSQREVDLLDLAENDFKTLPLPDVLSEADFPHLHFFLSSLEDGYVTEPESPCHREMKRPVLTFNTLLARTGFVRIMRALLARLESAYGHPVDTEFTASLTPTGEVSVNLVQCRPMRLPGMSDSPANVPEVPGELVLFRASRTISAGAVRDIRYIVYIHPRVYAEKAHLETKQTLGRIIGELNRSLEIQAHRVMMMGPGRWGSTNIMLGVNANYADLSHASVLVGMAREQAGHLPDVSYGTHFFLDLVESRVIYLPLYPDDPRADFNFGFFESSPNVLARLLKGVEKFEAFVKVIDVPLSSGNRLAHVMTDARKGCALCWLQEAQDEPALEAEREGNLTVSGL